MDKTLDLKNSVLKGYLRNFYCKPDMNPNLWAVARACMNNQDQSFFGIKFTTDTAMRQFCLAVLLSSGKQFNHTTVTSYKLLQDNLAGERLLTDYDDFDILFIIHEQGTMRNSIMGQSINQVCIQRSPKRTFFLDRGGYTLDLVFPVASSVSGLCTGQRVVRSSSNGDNL